jgi:hypothetical protein
MAKDDRSAALRDEIQELQDSRTTGRGSRANRQSQENRSTSGSLVRTNQAPANPNSKEVLSHAQLGHDRLPQKENKIK